MASETAKAGVEIGATHKKYTSSRYLSPEQVRNLTEAGVVGSKSVWSLHTGEGKNRGVKGSLVTNRGRIET